MRFKVIVSYDGSNFNGFQRQKEYRSVQEELEIALTKMHKHKVEIVGAGRTDKEVHALGQVFHFDSDIKIDSKGVKKGLNALLPSDIYVMKVEEVSEEFHARFSATSKLYRYKINIGEYDPLNVNYIIYFLFLFLFAKNQLMVYDAIIVLYTILRLGIQYYLENVLL